MGGRRSLGLPPIVHKLFVNFLLNPYVDRGGLLAHRLSVGHGGANGERSTSRKSVTEAHLRRSSTRRSVQIGRGIAVVHHDADETSALCGNEKVDGVAWRGAGPARLDRDLKRQRVQRVLDAGGACSGEQEK